MSIKYSSYDQESDIHRNAQMDRQKNKICSKMVFQKKKKKKKWIKNTIEKLPSLCVPSVENSFYNMIYRYRITSKFILRDKMFE